MENTISRLGRSIGKVKDIYLLAPVVLTTGTSYAKSIKSSKPQKEKIC